MTRPEPGSYPAADVNVPIRLFGGPFDGAPVLLEPKDRCVDGRMPQDLAPVAHWGHDYYLTSIDTQQVPPVYTYAYRYARSGTRQRCRHAASCGAGCPDSPARLVAGRGQSATPVPCPGCGQPTIVTGLADPYGHDTTRRIMVRLDAEPSGRGTVRFYGTYGVALPPPVAAAERTAGTQLHAVHSVSCARQVSGDA